MNIEKRTEFINQASDEIKSRAKVALHDVYMKGYYKGRQDYRSKVKNLLIINPKILELLKKNSEDPCIGCPNNKPEYKIGRVCVPGDCIAKQDQLTALDILKNFKTYEDIYTSSQSD